VESVQAASWLARSDLGGVQLLDRQSDGDARERSARAYRGSARATQVAPTPSLSSAPVLLELSGDAHPVEAFANFVEASVNERVQVRLVDTVTTRTLGELTVSASVANQPAAGDYAHLLPRWAAHPVTP
jgi:hypothetical protein